MDPAVALVAGVNPASITHGLVAVPSTGVLNDDLAALVAAFLAAHTPTAPVFVMPPGVAMGLGLGGAREVRADSTVGYVAGVPTIVSPHINVVALVDAQAVLLADTGEMEIDVSRAGTLQMDSAPASPADANTVYLSLWQTNHVGIRAERIAGWLRAMPTAVAYFVP